MEINLANSEERGYQNFTEENFDNHETLVEEELPVRQYAEDVSTLPAQAGETNPIFRKMIRWLVYAAAFLTPLWFLPWTADITAFNKQTLLIAAAGIGLVIWLVDVIKSGAVRYKPSNLYLPVFGLVAAGIISVIFSVSRTASLFGAAGDRSWSLISLMALAVLFMLAVNVIEDQGRFLRKIIIVSLALAFLYGALQIFGLYLFKGELFASRSFNSVGSLNSLGILAALALAFFTVSGSVRTVNQESQLGSLTAKWQDWVMDGARYVGLALALFFVILVNWWPIWTVAFISLLAFVAFASASNTALLKRGRMKLFAIPMAVIVLGIFLMLINFNWVSIKSKLPVEIAPAQKISWAIAVDSLKMRPMGHGMENFGIAYDKFKPASIANTVFYQIRFMNAASEIVNMAVEGGILMILAFLALLWFYGKSLVASVKNNFNGIAGSSANWAVSFGLLAVFFLYPLNLPLLTLFFMFLVLTSLSSLESAEEKIINLESDAKYSFVGSVVFIVGLVAVSVAGYFTVNNYLANVYLAKAARSSDRNKAIEYYVASANTNGKDARVYRLLSQTVLAELSENLKIGPKKDETRENYNARIQNQIASAVSITIRATDADPADSQNWANRGLIYHNLITLVSGADQAAINTYNESLARNPNDPATYLRIGNIYFTLADNLQKSSGTRNQIEDNLNKAEDNFKKAIALYSNYGQALYNLAAVYDRQGKVPNAIKQFEKLQANNLRNPSFAFQLGLLYYRNNQKDNALRAWQQAVLLFPNYSNARWYLSLIYEERGELEQALGQVREIEKFNHDNKLVQQRLTQLEAGKRTIPPEKLLDKEPLNQ
ncbi:MAG: tetratricopeptide repeat protein [Candidatus Yanofskybacteria bacterium]|nr:tetratricopeptide repeat protein [Candidatus Yanofskybacteria bacterium]